MFLLHIDLGYRKSSDMYPFEHPYIEFISKVYHPNVYTDGRICLDTIQQKWTPANKLDTLLLSIRSLLSDPNPLSPANQEANENYMYNRKVYWQRVRECVQQSLQQVLPKEILQALE